MNSALLDLGTTIHVFFNEIARFPELPNGHPGGFVCTGEHNIYIWAHDNVDIEIQDVNSKRIFQLDRCPTTYNISKKLPKEHLLENLGFVMLEIS
jgi:hypothetical protein